MSLAKKLLFFASIGAVAASGFAQVSDQQALSAFLRPLIERHIFSGSVVVARGGQTIAEEHAGLANRELLVPVTAATRFYVASVTKSFTAAAILMLRDGGALSLDDQIRKFMPDFPHGEVTIRQLLTHTSGFQHPVFYPDYYELAKRSYTPAEAVALFKDRAVIGPAGAQRRYSDYNYIVLARIVEIVSGKTYGEFLSDRIFRPQHMETAGNHVGWSEMVPNRASGYQPIAIADFQNARYYDYSIGTGASSLYMSAEDLSRWIAALGEGRVLGVKSTQELVGTSEGAGILQSRTVAGHRAIALSGWDNVGFTSDALYFSDAKLTVVVTSNMNDSGIASYISDAVAESLLSRKKLLAPEFLKHASDVDRYVGTYRLGSDFYVPGQELQLVKVGDQLCERQKNPDRLMGLIPMADGSFMYRSHWSRVTFQQENGSITGLTFDGFKAVKVR